MPPQPIPPLWQPMLHSIVEWAKPDDANFPDVKLGSIQGRAGDNLSASVPFALWSALSRSNPDMLVIHALPGSIVDAVGEKRRRWNTDDTKFDLATLSLPALLEVLKCNTIPPVESLQPGGWQNGLLPRQVLIIVEVDTDVSVELALVLAAGLTWCCGTAIAAQTPSVAPPTSTRLLTLSSESLHPLIDDFMQVFDDVHSFILPPLRMVEYNKVDSGKTAMESLVETVQRLPANSSHTVLCLQPEAEPPQQWEAFTMHGEPIEFLDQPGPHRRVVFISHEDAKVHKIVGSDYMHLVIGNTRSRAIFDRWTSQTMHVNLWLSYSELARQLEWVEFFDVDEANIYVYRDRPAMEPLRYQLADAASGGMAGFLVGILDFPLWPQGNLRWASTVVGNPDRLAKSEVERQLRQRNLLAFEGPSIRPALALEEAQARLFHRVLPVVKYNERIAHFVASPSTTPNVALAKAQVAAVMTVGCDNLVDHARITRDQVTEANPRGLLIGNCQWGTLWFVVAIVEKALHKLEQMPGLSQGIRHVTLVEGSLDVIMRPGALRVRGLISTLQEVYASCGVATAPTTWNEVDTLNTGEWDNLYRDLIMAFSHQVAVCSIGEDGRARMHDIASREGLSVPRFVHSTIDWEYVEASSKGGVFVGVYTSVIRLSVGTPACVTDWTWIPSNLVREWTARIHGRSLLGLSGLYPRHVNDGERQGYWP